MDGWMDIGQAQRMDDYMERLNGWMDGHWTGQADGLYREAQRMAGWIDGQAQRMDDYIERINGWMDGHWTGPADG